MKDIDHFYPHHFVVPQKNKVKPKNATEKSYLRNWKLIFFVTRGKLQNQNKLIFQSKFSERFLDWLISKWGEMTKIFVIAAIN